MLRRLGKKDPQKYLQYFPERVSVFVDMFMGTGALTFAMKDLCQYVIANDKESHIKIFFFLLKIMAMNY